MINGRHLARSLLDRDRQHVHRQFYAAGSQPPPGQCLCERPEGATEYSPLNKPERLYFSRMLGILDFGHWDLFGIWCLGLGTYFQFRIL
jgi:hypothetical protein